MNWPAFLDIPEKITQIIGVDEVGRGALAGPMTLGFCQTAVADMKIIEKIEQLNDSKKLSAKKRQAILGLVLQDFTSNIKLWSVDISATQIDNLGIRNCYLKVLDKVTKQVNLNSTLFLSDFGIPKPDKIKDWQSIKKGDSIIPVIALASICAKQSRDLLMQTKLHKQFPDYGFDCHVGYATKKHREVIRTLGLTRVHRQSFCTRIISN